MRRTLNYLSIIIFQIPLQLYRAGGSADLCTASVLGVQRGLISSPWSGVRPQLIFRDPRVKTCPVLVSSDEIKLEQTQDDATSRK